MKSPLAATALLCVFVPVLHAQLNSTDPPYQAICRAAFAKPFTPPPADAAIKPDCDASASYFGIGRPVDFSAARACAYAEYAQPETDTSSNIFFGAGILSMIYANGSGTAADLDLAIRFTCEKFAAPAEMETRLDVLTAARDNHATIDFNLCDSATSGNAVSWCTSVEARLSEIERNQRLEALRAKLASSAHAPFDDLQKAEDAFLQLHLEDEIDLTGTDRRSLQLIEENDLRDQWLADLEAVTVPGFHEDTSLKAADKRLSAAWRPVQIASVKSRMPRAAKTLGDTTISFRGIEDTQQAWLRLRDAWTTFAQAENPAPKVDAQIEARVTLERAQQLQELFPSKAQRQK